MVDERQFKTRCKGIQKLAKAFSTCESGCFVFDEHQWLCVRDLLARELVTLSLLKSIHEKRIPAKKRDEIIGAAIESLTHVEKWLKAADAKHSQKRS